MRSNGYRDVKKAPCYVCSIIMLLLLLRLAKGLLLVWRITDGEE